MKCKMCGIEYLGDKFICKSCRIEKRKEAQNYNILTSREIKIIEMSFGLYDGIPHTLEEVGQDFGVTRERIRQIRAKALEKLTKIN